jgi:hypothetical protein
LSEWGWVSNNSSVYCDCTELIVGLESMRAGADDAHE